MSFGIGADAGDRLADRVHDAARRLSKRSAVTWNTSFRVQALATTCSRGEDGAPHRRANGSPTAMPWPLERTPHGTLAMKNVRRCDAARSTDGRWHFQHGPIDCIVARPTATRARCGRVASSTRGRAFAACSTSWWPSCRCCAPTFAIGRGRARRAAWSRSPRGWWTRASAPTRRPAASSRRWRPSPAASPKRSSRRSTTRASSAPTSTTAATSRCISRRARRSTSASSPTRRAGSHGLPLDGRFAIEMRRVASARRRHLRLARAQLLARHRRLAVTVLAAHRRDRRRRRNGDRQRGRHRRPGASCAARRTSFATTATSATDSSRCAVPPLSIAAIDAALAAGAAAARAADRARAHHRGRAVAAGALAPSSRAMRFGWRRRHADPPLFRSLASC